MQKRVWKWWVGVAVVLVLAAWVLARFGVPWLILYVIRDREARALDAVREVLAAERRYSLENDGRFADMECLAALRPGCTKKYVDVTLVPSISAFGGYDKRFDGIPASPNRESGRIEIQRFAYRAEPVANLAYRYFCGDSTGRVCSNRGRPVPVVDGICSLSCDEEHAEAPIKP